MALAGWRRNAGCLYMDFLSKQVLCRYGSKYLLLICQYWNRHKKSELEELPITHTPKKYILPLTVFGILLFAFIAFILARFTDSPVPYGDSLTTALSILGMWLLAQKYVEQWWFWFAINIVSCGLYIWKGLHTTSILFAIYSVISVFGYFKWKKMMHNQSQPTIASVSSSTENPAK